MALTSPNVTLISRKTNLRAERTNENLAALVLLALPMQSLRRGLATKNEGVSSTGRVERRASDVALHATQPSQPKADARGDEMLNTSLRADVWPQKL